jgi:hypothetical protein
MRHRWLLVLCVLAGLVPPGVWAQGQLINGNRVITGTFNAGTTTGTAVAYVLTLNPAITQYIPNQCFTFRAHLTNTGAATLNVNGAGAAPLKKYVGAVVTDLSAGDVASGQPFFVCYDGVNMSLIGGTGSGGAAAGVPSGTTPPATCTVGQVFFDTDAPAGRNVYGCTTTNTWTLEGDGVGTAGGLPDPGANGIVVRNNATPTTINRTIIGTTNEVTIANGDGVAGNPTVSFPPTVSLASHGLVFPSSSGAPPTCTTGQIYFDTAASAGRNVFGCTATNVWTLQGDGVGATGSGAPTDVPYWTSTASAALSAETNLGGLAAGTSLLMHTVSGGVSTPANAVAGTHYVLPSGNVATATALAANKPACPANQYTRDMDADGTLICAQPASTQLSDSTDIVRLTTVQKVTNKQNVPREVVYTPAGSPLTITPNCDTTDVVVVDTIGAALTIADPVCTGTNPEKSQELLFRLFSTAPRALTFGSGYSTEAGVPFPASTTGNGTTYDYLKAIRNSQTSKWDIVATRGQERTVTTLASGATLTCNIDVSSQCQSTNTQAALGTITIAQPAGTPVDGQFLMILLLCQNAQTIAHATIFLASPNIPLPTSCPVNMAQHLIMGYRYSAVLSKWQILASN